MTLALADANCSGPTDEIDTSTTRRGLTISVNGRLTAIATGTTVEDLVCELCESHEGVAVARNREVVPRSEWATTIVEPGDRLEVVTAAAGG